MRRLAVLMLMLFTVAAPAAEVGRQSVEPAIRWGHIEGTTVTIETSDGVRLVGLYRPARGTTLTVILTPMLANTIEPYCDLAAELQRRGIGTFAYDQRGVGQSICTTTGTISYQQFKNAPSGEWARIVDDVDAVVNHLQTTGIAPENLAIVGASIGANAALLHSASAPRIRKLVLLSPGEEYRGLAVTEAAGQLAGRDVMIVTGDQDRYSHASSRRIAEIAGKSGARVKLEILPTNRLHGTSLLKEPLPAQITNWLLER